MSKNVNLALLNVALSVSATQSVESRTAGLEASIKLQQYSQ